jgi:hypothetical protein
MEMKRLKLAALSAATILPALAPQALASKIQIETRAESAKRSSLKKAVQSSSSSVSKAAISHPEDQKVAGSLCW